jgi:hypothetical protein
MLDSFKAPFSRKVSKTKMRMTQRKKTASNFCLFDSTNPLPITFLWLALHYLFLGLADLFTLGGVFVEY